MLSRLQIDIHNYAMQYLVKRKLSLIVIADWRTAIFTTANTGVGGVDWPKLWQAGGTNRLAVYRHS